MSYLFHESIPLPWLLGDLVAIAATLLTLLYVVRRSRHAVVALLEAFCFVFLYASVFENFAVVQGWYVYGRSLVMIGSVPLAVPLIELDVLLVGLALLERLKMPDWSKPVVIGLFGMLQDFSIDPVAVRQLFESGAGLTGRWSWLLPSGAANIYGIPVYNFPGWMLIMLYASAYLLAGRWWFRRTGYRRAVGYLYPFLAMIAALVTMGSPISSFLLWLGPIFAKGSSAEWGMLAFHLAVPALVLALVWRGRMRTGLSLSRDFPLFVVPIALHAYDLAAAIAGGYSSVLWLVITASALHVILLAVLYAAARLHARRSVSASIPAFARP